MSSGEVSPTTPSAAAAPLRDPTARRRWMGVLAKAPVAELARLWARVREVPAHRVLRAPETGLVMVRGRVGGAGDGFNLGEMAVTRCSVALAGGWIGHAYIGGSDHRHALLAALCDGLLQDPARHGEIEAGVIAPLEKWLEERRLAAAERTAATRVEFFTVARETRPP